MTEWRIMYSDSFKKSFKRYRTDKLEKELDKKVSRLKVNPFIGGFLSKDLMG